MLVPAKLDDVFRQLLDLLHRYDNGVVTGFPKSLLLELPKLEEVVDALQRYLGILCGLLSVMGTGMARPGRTS